MPRSRFGRMPAKQSAQRHNEYGVSHFTLLCICQYNRQAKVRAATSMMVAMAGGLPLFAELSQLLVAFVIECDNEFEHQTPHRTTNHGRKGPAGVPWLVSMAMWWHFMRFVPPGGIPAGELQRSLGLDRKSALALVTRMGKWWSYVTVESGVVRPTAGGRKALAVWQPLEAAIERRWQERFGRDRIEQLRESLRAVAGRLDPGLPDSLPILGFGLFSRPQPQGAMSASDSLPALVAKILLAFAVEFESESEVSLAICADVLRLMGEGGVRVRDLPRLAGVSKEAIAMAVSFLKERGYTASAGAALTLTAKGRQALDAYCALVPAIEERWQSCFGAGGMRALREALEQVPAVWPEPYPDGWRASVPRPEVLPHYPMVLHRGGFPDGS